MKSSTFDPLTALFQKTITKPEDFLTVKEALAKKFGPPESSGVLWKPHNTVALNQAQAEDMIELIETLEDSDDVQNVFANFEIDDAIMAKLAS